MADAPFPGGSGRAYVVRTEGAAQADDPVVVKRAAMVAVDLHAEWVARVRQARSSQSRILGFSSRG